MSNTKRKNEMSQSDDLPFPDDFYGVLTDGFRKLLRHKIAELNVSKMNVARYFDITPQTLHKWEYGPTYRLSASTCEKFRPFICGEVDMLVKSQIRPGHASQQPHPILPDSIMFCMERISKVYDICAQSPETGEEFIRKMDKAAISALRELLPPMMFRGFAQKEKENIIFHSRNNQEENGKEP
ncbi:MAG: hypothetical protein IKP00_10745 [Victivallales bacterium]|nr:hypothetical protein [Victivallales bacterium]